MKTEEMLLTSLDYNTQHQIKVENCHLTKIIKYANYLIKIFMNINVNIRHKTKLAEK